MANSRLDGVMSDSAYIILTAKASKTTDNFFMDDEVLISSGMNLDDLNKYMPTSKTTPGKLIPDFMS